MPTCGSKYSKCCLGRSVQIYSPQNQLIPSFLPPSNSLLYKHMLNVYYIPGVCKMLCLPPWGSHT